MSWIDIVFLVLVAICAIAGLWRGLFESILNLFGTGLCVFLAIWLNKPFANFLRSFVAIDSWFDNLLSNSFSDTIIDNFMGISLTRLQLASLCTVIVCTIVVFILLKLSIRLLSKLFENTVTKNSSLSGINRLLGLVFGIVKGLFINCCLLAVCSIIAWFPGFGSTLQSAIQNTSITNFFYKYVDEYVENKITSDDLKNIINIEQDIIVNAVPSSEGSLKIVYSINEEVDYSNCIIILTFDNNTSKTITVEQENFKTGINTGSLGQRNAIVEYEEYTFNFNYIVVQN